MSESNSPYQEVIPRMSKMNEKLLSMLEEAGENGVTNVEFSNNGLIRYGGIIGNLQRKGYVIDRELIDTGIYKYTLIKRPSVIKTPEKAIDIIVRDIRRNYNNLITSNDLIDLLNKNGFHLSRNGDSYKNQNLINS